MRLSMGCEADEDIYGYYARIRNRIEKAVNGALGRRKYGAGLKQWAYIAMIFAEAFPSGYKEVKHYHKRTKVCEFRLEIDHEKFKEADRPGRTSLVCQSLLRSLEIMDGMRIPDVDVARLRADFLSVATQKGWIR